MGKKSAKSAKIAATQAMASTCQPLLELKHEDPVFSLAAHPTRPLIVTGSASGRVKLLSYDAELLADKLKANSKTGKTISSGESTKKKPWLVSKLGEKDEILGAQDSGFAVQWKTKRHKGSCRSISFDKSGDHVYTVGLDKIIKCASTETGQVVKKSDEMKDWSSNVTQLLKAPNKDMLLVGTESGNLFVYDSRTFKQVYMIPNLHDDAINKMTHMAGSSDYKYISVGSTTVTEFDIRKGIVRQSEDQEDEILAVDYVDRENFKTLSCGMGDGVVTIWKPEKNNLSDQISRVRVSKESVETIVSTMDDTGDSVWAGTADGLIKKVNTRMGKVTEARIHSMNDDVSFLDIDFDYRLISCGMDKLKIWSADAESDEEESDFSRNSSDSEEDDNSEDDIQGGHDGEAKEVSDVDSFESFGSDDWEDMLDDSGEGEEDADDAEGAEGAEESEGEDENEDESELAVLTKLAVKRRFAPAKADQTPIETISNAPAEEDKPAAEKPKKKQKKLTGKQLKNMQTHEHGIRKFDDL
ncbi:unnamed protein product [Kuraishia capsulata CBS 1993]|uniref:WD repeat-containing protein JIP5 n=1 Tax=Kuraishia capsulata CBS 1993 TaxID=1382522 RepID=W6MFV6_9ASCO|nr:uncharacterized protein KUCA_T00000475001 [Kuraishia capsulata CBS 1993]CDK24511.1 unnamed protein product [Kuraishia capsulata CBS 1993]